MALGLLYSVLILHSLAALAAPLAGAQHNTRDWIDEEYHRLLCQHPDIFGNMTDCGPTSLKLQRRGLPANWWTRHIVTADIAVGSEQQTVPVVIDTTVGDLRLTPKSSMQDPTTGFLETESFSYYDTNIPFGESAFGQTVKGTWAWDDISYADHTVEKQVFVAVTESDRQIPNAGGIAGVRPLASSASLSLQQHTVKLPDMPRISTSSFFFQVAVLSKLRPFFSLYQSPDGVSKPHFCLGCIDRSAYTDALRYYPLQTDSLGTLVNRWSLRATGVVYDRRTIAKPFDAVFGSASPLTLLPQPIVDEIHQSIPGVSFDEDRGRWFVPCDARAPDISIVFQGDEYKFDPEYFVDTTSPQSFLPNAPCGTTILGHPKVGLLGVGFLKDYYVTYEFSRDVAHRRIGIARAVVPQTAPES